MSRFVEKAVKAYLFDQLLKETQEETAKISEPEMARLVEEVINWAKDN